MVEIRFEVETALSPQRVRAGATDFSERRPQIWSGIDPEHFRVHALGDGTAEVTEGGREFGGIWAREHYDWSDPDRVVARVLDSNIFRSGSRWELLVRPTPTGGSRVDWTSLRQPSSLKGRLVVLVLMVAGRRLLRGYLQQTLSNLENQTTPRTSR
jgi:Polyketide cyclase / dehydrase and lipid transport